MSKYPRYPFITTVWDACVSHEITRTTYHIARVLVRMADRHGRAWPSRAFLAGAVGCAESSVEIATNRLRELGWLSWRRRKVRWNRYDSNLYQLADLSPRPFKSAKSAESKEESNCDSSSGKIGEGSIDPKLARALARLGAAIGASVDGLSRDLGLREAALEGTATG